jgi:hypothetical protein
MNWRRVIGAFRLLRARCVEVEQPGLGMWAEMGETAAGAVGVVIRDQAHAAETDDAEAARLLRSALEGGIGPEDEGKIQAALRHVQRSEAHDHDLGEVVNL